MIALLVIPVALTLFGPGLLGVTFLLPSDLNSVCDACERSIDQGDDMYKLFCRYQGWEMFTICLDCRDHFIQCDECADEITINKQPRIMQTCPDYTQGVS